MSTLRTGTAPERISSPLASNNPFRNKVGSGATSPVDAPVVARPVSKNPFLDASEVAAEPTQPAGTSNTASSKGGATARATELLADLNLNGKPQSPTRPPRAPMNGDARRENMPPRPYGRGPPPGHRPPLTEEERKRREAKMRERAQKGELDIFADPLDQHRRDKYRPRRNSESSLREKSARDPEEEKKRRERKYRESKRLDKNGKPQRRLDVIDKLDVTSIYGTGLFHHDGPFDACNPHRNRKGSRQAPMQAFPEGSLNMQLGGSGPLNKHIDLNRYHGTEQEAHIDYNEAAVVDEDAAYMRRANPGRDEAFDPTARVEPIHGEVSTGLGTSTFLEGAPASRIAIQRRESENQAAQQAQMISRKKSLAQRIRGTRSNTIGNRTMSPDGGPITPLDTGRSDSVVNPFFKDYDQEYEKKGQQIAIAQEEQKAEAASRARAPSSPRRGLGLERTRTADSAGLGEEGKQESKATSLLNRVKSLKGGRRMRPERRDTSG